MNRGITRVATVALVLLVALIVGTTYWQVWASSSLAAKQDNAIQRVAQFTVRRGKIEGSAGKTIYATNLRRKVKGQTLYFRKYPNRGMLAQTVGYSTQERSRTGLESSLNDYLTGTNSNLNTVLKTNLDRLQGITVTGNNVFLTVDPRSQRIAQGALGTQCGAVFALEPSTGKVLVAASSPTFDLNLADKPNFIPNVSKIHANCRPASPLLNRGTNALFPPGSSFKVVTAAAALDTGLYRPQSSFYDPGYCVEYGKRVRNAGDPESPEQFGTLSLARRSSTRSTPSSARSASGSGRRGSSTTRSASASTRSRRSRRRRTSASRAGCTPRGSSTTRRTTPRSTRAGSLSGRNG